MNAMTLAAIQRVGGLHSYLNIVSERLTLFETARPEADLCNEQIQFQGTVQRSNWDKFVQTVCFPPTIISRVSCVRCLQTPCKIFDGLNLHFLNLETVTYKTEIAPHLPFTIQLLNGLS